MRRYVVDFDPPGVVTGFTLTNRDVGYQLAWNPVPKSRFYTVLRGTTSIPQDATVVARLGGTDNVSYLDIPNDPAAGETFYYWVFAENLRGVAGPLSIMLSAENRTNVSSAINLTDSVAQAIFTVSGLGSGLSRMGQAGIVFAATVETDDGSNREMWSGVVSASVALTPLQVGTDADIIGESNAATYGSSTLSVSFAWTLTGSDIECTVTSALTPLILLRLRYGILASTPNIIPVP
jgi:hypothetical protein